LNRNVELLRNSRSRIKYLNGIVN